MDRALTPLPGGAQEPSADVAFTALDCRDGEIAQAPFDLSAHRLSLLMMNTGAKHALGVVTEDETASVCPSCGVFSVSLATLPSR